MSTTGTIKYLLTIFWAGVAGCSGFLLNLPTTSIQSKSLQSMIGRDYDFEKNITPWQKLLSKPSNGSEYKLKDEQLDSEMVTLRNSLKGEVENCLLSSSSSTNDGDCKGNNTKQLEKIKPHIKTMKDYCEKQKSRNITGKNLGQNKGHMYLCYDMSDAWYWISN